jgi:L-lactate utilization protein LutB
MDEKQAYWEARIGDVKRALEKNGITVLAAADGDEAREKALSLIPRGAAVGLGGSRTVSEIGLLDALRSGDFRLFDQYDQALGAEASQAARKAGTHADYFVAGSNAITDDGKIVNIDGMGNRVAAFAYGPGKVIIVAGRNKIVRDVDAAVDRIKNIAAPMNARRFGANTPCARTGRCSDCASPERICSITMIIEKQRQPGRITVILVNQDLGF